MQTATAIKRLDLHFNSLSAPGGRGEGGAGSGPWASDFPPSREANDQSGSTNFDLFFYFCPNWRVYEKKLHVKSAFFFLFVTALHLGVRSNFNPPRYPLLFPSPGQGSPPHHHSQTIPYFIRDAPVRLCHGNSILLRKVGGLLPRPKKCSFLLAVYCAPSIG